MLKNNDILREIGLDPQEVERAVATGRTITSLQLYPWLDGRIRADEKVVIDGYPRAAHSAAPFAALAQSLLPGRSVFALVMNCSPEITHARVRTRGRADDDERVLQRDHEFETVQVPLLAKLPAEVRRIDIDASRATPDVFAVVERALGLTAPSERG